MWMAYTTAFPANRAWRLSVRWNRNGFAGVYPYGEIRFRTRRMMTKCSIARKVADEGIEVIIANGKRDDVLTDLVLRPGSRVCTRFAPREGNVSSVKKWVAHSTGFTKGKVYLNAKAVEAVCGDRAVSILPVGHACGRRF